MKDDARILIEMAHMYYEENKTQSEIAERFFVSRSLVSKYLSKAKELGIVEVTINSDLIQPFWEIEEQLKKLYNLEEVICVEGNDDISITHNRIGIAAAKYLNRVIRDDSIVGLSAGRAVQSVIENFSNRLQKPDITVVPLTGGLGEKQTDIQANVIGELLAQRLGARSIHLHAPVIVDNPQAKSVFISQSFIKKVFDLAAKANIAIVGIGGQQTFYDMSSLYFHKLEEPIHVDENRVAGDICYQFIDDNGEVVDCDWNSRVLSLSLELLRNIPLVIAVAGGKIKRRGIMAALKSKAINVLVTDLDICEHLINNA